MLKSVKVINYRCLKDVNVPLRPLTVLVGPNDSGKTTLLHAVNSLIGHSNPDAVTDFWRCESQNKIQLTAETPWGQLEHKTSSIRAKVGPSQIFRLPSEGVATLCNGYSGGEEKLLPIGTSGDRIAALLDHLLRRDRQRFAFVENQLRELIPGLVSIEIGTPNPQQREIELVIENGLRIPAGLTSVGLRIMLFFVVLAHHPNPPRTILLEEPENGVHPKRLADVMQLLRDLTKGKYGGHAAQVILTTHSPYLLDSVRIEEDQVLVFHRNDDGSRDAKPVDAERLKSFLDDFMLGEIWYNEEEAGLVAGPQP